MNHLVDRVFKNWKTSLVGASLFWVGIALVYLDKVTLVEAGGFIATGFTLFFLKDGKEKK